MRKLVFALCALTLISMIMPSQLIAEESECDFEKYLGELRRQSDRVVFDENKKVEDQLLFFRFADEQLAGGLD